MGLMVETEARGLLNAELEGWTQSSLARLLGVRQSRVSLWSSGRSRPEAHHREALWLLLGIPTTAWFTLAETKFLRRIAKVRRGKLRNGEREAA